MPKEIKSRFNLDYSFKEKDFYFVLEAINQNKVPKDSALEILVEIAKGKEPNLDRYKKADDEELEKYIKELVKKNKELSTNALMGEIMKEYKGKVDGKKVMQILKRLR